MPITNLYDRYTRQHPLIASKQKYDPNEQQRLNQIISSQAAFKLNQLRVNLLLTTESCKNSDSHVARPPMLIQQDDIEGMPYKVIITMTNQAYIVYDESLGKGSFSEVLLAIDADTGEHVAIKMQTANLYEPPNEKLLKILKESKILKQLDLLIDQSTFYFDNFYYVFQVQKLAWGKDFFDTLLNEELNLRYDISELTKAKMAYSACSQLQALYAKKILHLDVKLENFVWDPDTETASLVDYGFARHAVTKNNKLLVIKKDPVGTMEYLAPEIVREHFLELDFFIRRGVNQKNSTVEYNLATEMYAFGIMLVYIFSNRFSGYLESEKDFEIYNNLKILGILPELLESAPDILSDDISNLPIDQKNLYTLIQRAVDLNPYRRPSFEQMQAGISAYLNYLENKQHLNNRAANKIM